MAKVFSDGDLIDAAFLNKVSASVTDGIGDKKTPGEVRVFIGAEVSGAASQVQTNLDSHKADSGIHFPDAPNDTKDYVRGQGTWKIAVLTEAPLDSETYGRRNGAWSVVSGTGQTDHQTLLNRSAVDSHPVAAVTGLTAKHSTYDAHLANILNPHQVTALQTGADPAGSADAVQGNLDTHEATTHLGDSPADGQYYGRKDLGWAIIPGTGTGVDPSDHSQLLNRDAVDSHPQSAITGLSAKISTYDGHVASSLNPHSVTAAQVNADPAGSAATVAGNLSTHETDTAAHIGHATSDTNAYVSIDGAWGLLNDNITLPPAETDHTQMTNRDQPDQHAIGSIGISGGIQLQDEIDRIDAEVALKATSAALTAHAGDINIHYADVPAADGIEYVRKNRAWVESSVVPGTGDLKSDGSVPMSGSYTAAPLGQSLVTRTMSEAVFTDRLKGFKVDGFIENLTTPTDLDTVLWNSDYTLLNSTGHTNMPPSVAYRGHLKTRMLQSTQSGNQWYYRSDWINPGLVYTRSRNNETWSEWVLENLDSSKVSKSGDTMTGLLTLSGDATDDLQAVTKQQTLQRDNTGTITAQRIWSGTQTDYDALTPDSNTLYFISGV